MIPVYCFKCIGKDQCDHCKKCWAEDDGIEDMTHLGKKASNDPINLLVIDGEK